MSEVFFIDVRFSGRVQGVGFRAQTLHIARGFEVTGRVANLADGSVHLQAEGEEREVNDFLEEVCRQLAAYIRNTDTKISRGARRFKDFQIDRFS